MGLASIVSLLDAWCSSFLFPKTFEKSFIYFYFGMCWVFAAAWAFLQLPQVGAVSSCSAQPSHCSGLSLCKLGCVGFRSCGSWALEHRLCNCGARAQLLCSMWGLFGLGIEPVSLTLTGEPLSTEPPGKPEIIIIFFDVYCV